MAVAAATWAGGGGGPAAGTSTPRAAAAATAAPPPAAEAAAWARRADVPRALATPLAAKGTRATHDSGPITLCKRRVETMRKARTASGSNWLPAFSVICDRASCMLIGVL